MHPDKPTRPECPACEGRSTRRLWSLRFASHPGPFPLWNCADCGAAFNWPRLPAGSVHEQYDADYYIFKLPAARRWARAAQLYLEYLRPIEHPRGRRLLDIGCAQGDLLALAARRGWDVHGVEISPGPARRAAEQYGIPVEVGTIEEKGPALEPFDVVIATDVVEHVTAPREFARAVRRVLKPGGLAILETPNFGGFWRKLGGPRWIGLNRFHLVLFTPGALLRLMRASGFRACRARSCTHTAYSHWDHRPELEPLIRPLPAALRWRVRRGLNRATPTTTGARLWQDPPCCLEDALARIGSGEHYHTSARRQGSLAGDNLCVIGRA